MKGACRIDQAYKLRWRNDADAGSIRQDSDDVDRRHYAKGSPLCLLAAVTLVVAAAPPLRAAEPAQQMKAPATQIQLTAFNKRSYCLRYTKLAIAAQRRNLNERCGFTGDRWSSDVRRHTRWCLQTPVDRSRAATAARQNAIMSCTTRTKTGYCAQYLRTATVDFFRRDEDRCGSAGTHWRLRGTALKNWCLKVSRDQSAKAALRRAQDLARCAATRRKGG